MSGTAVGIKITKVNKAQLVLSETRACWRQEYEQTSQCAAMRAGPEPSLALLRGTEERHDARPEEEGKSAG